MSTTFAPSTPGSLHVNPETTKADGPSIAFFKQPEIGYQPNEIQWKVRAAKRLGEDPALPRTPLPEGFPAKLESPLVWEGKNWKDPKEWEYELSADHLKEIDDAVKHFNGLGQLFGQISAKTFPLPTLGFVLRELSKELHNGRGFLSYARYPSTTILAKITFFFTLEFLLISDLVELIKDLTEAYPLKAVGSPAYTTEKQVFHTDKGDIISLFCADPFYVSRPLLYWKDPHIIIQYARRLFTRYLGLPRSSNIPPITEAQAEALDTLHFLAEKYSLVLSFQKGDI
ncbi:hypothetical protein BDN70DRAFT_934573 [Pholiota conissans]|uniref:Uncharacterized protein n=1 Tax=Pholiota conissans TaxID=109636 RepID=A0A9P5YX31_9AGAR|nr:hypothetical protein BDN70DRAFT_934573 [Pholiota conissans]